MSALADRVRELVAEQRAHLDAEQRQALADAYLHQADPIDAAFARLACERPNPCGCDDGSKP